MRFRMAVRIAILALLLSLCLASRAAAQNLCASTDSNKVACTVANAFGPGGLSTNGQALVQRNTFGNQQSTFFLNLNALNASVGSQLGQLPLVSPASGIAFSFDKSLGVFVPQQYNFGSILSERGGTLGRHKFLVGFSYQSFDFDTLDGTNLKNLPSVFSQADVGSCSASSASTSQAGCAFIRDVILTTNALDLRVNQYTAFVSFGLTERLDVSVAIPTVNVRMAVTSAATIKNNGSDSNIQFVDPSTGQGCLPNPCFNRSFFNSRGATGIGDVTIRGKYTVWKGEKASLGLGADLRLPTGDSLDYLGGGAVGIKGFAAWSRSGKLSPHLNFGYEWNGSSFLAGDLAPSQANGTVKPFKDNLPGQILYSAGAEYGLFKRLSVAFDYLGNMYFNAPRIQSSTFQELGACTAPPPPGPVGLSACNSFAATGAVDANIIQTKGSFTTSSAAVGLRFRPFNQFLITANVVAKLDDPGLRAKYVPLLGISYSH